MTIPSGPQPAPGLITSGQLYVDAQSKLAWLGVPATEDPSQSVLIMDIAGLMLADSNNLNTANAYTDSIALTKAALVHTHAISDVVGLTAALAAASTSVPSGVICLWHGILADIPSGWALCNGSNGTPDLRDKFVMGAGGTNTTLATGGNVSSTATSSNSGAHTPTGVVGDTALNISQIPSHTHPGSVTDAQGNHAHNVIGKNNALSYGGPGINLNNVGFDQVQNIMVTDVQGNHAHNVTVAAQGGNAAHGHTLSMSAVGGHTHTVTTNVLPPYIVLGYIMKV